MKIQITMIGLGQIGGSIGLALASKSELIDRIGYDVDPKAMRQASKLGVVDKTSMNLSKVLKTSDALLMALPTDEMRPMMEELVPLMKPNAILLDTSLSKEKTAAWAAELLPEGCYYVGLTPVINPAYWSTTTTGIESARADMFHNGMMVITSPPNTDAKAVKFAADLTQLLDASVLFADILEVDSIMAATQTVPQLLSAALLNATVNLPNWSEAGKFAGRTYADLTGLVEYVGSPDSLTANAVQNREHVLRALDSLINSIRTLRDDIHAEDADTLNQHLESAYQGRQKWWIDRHPELRPAQANPYKKQTISSMMFGDLFRSRRKKEDEENQE
jgi:prephenate dehydrogenase